MRNDEKIDINLATEDTSENLSEEELAQQNYETALRYINIAEHMNKFEDQDKYYHRAIQYLKKAKPYKKVQPLLREVRNKKFGTRAAGKIELYKEACHIRDTFSLQITFFIYISFFCLPNFKDKNKFRVRLTNLFLFIILAADEQA